MPWNNEDIEPCRLMTTVQGHMLLGDPGGGMQSVQVQPTVQEIDARSL